MVKVIYKCEYCNTEFEERSEVLKHEVSCKHNPTNKCCDTCKNYTFRESHEYTDWECQIDGKNLNNHTETLCSNWEKDND